MISYLNFVRFAGSLNHLVGNSNKSRNRSIEMFRKIFSDLGVSTKSTYILVNLTTPSID